MPLRTSLLLLPFVSLVVSACQASAPPPTATTIDVPPATAEAPASAPPVADAGTAEKRELACDKGYVDLSAAPDPTRRFARGRQLTPTRGAAYAHAEVVRHQDGTNVLVIEGLAAAGKEGHVVMKVLNFAPPTKFPAEFDAEAEYIAAPGAKETTVQMPLVLTAFSSEGGWVEGRFGHSLRVAALTSIDVQFRVCRTADWVVRR